MPLCARVSNDISLVSPCPPATQGAEMTRVIVLANHSSSVILYFPELVYVPTESSASLSAVCAGGEILQRLPLPFSGPEPIMPRANLEHITLWPSNAQWRRFMIDREALRTLAQPPPRPIKVCDLEVGPNLTFGGSSKQELILYLSGATFAIYRDEEGACYLWFAKSQRLWRTLLNSAGNKIHAYTPRVAIRPVRALVWSTSGARAC